MIKRFNQMNESIISRREMDNIINISKDEGVEVIIYATKMFKGTPIKDDKMINFLESYDDYYFLNFKPQGTLNALSENIEISDPNIMNGIANTLQRIEAISSSFKYSFNKNIVTCYNRVTQEGSKDWKSNCDEWIKFIRNVQTMDKNIHVTLRKRAKILNFRAPFSKTDDPIDFNIKLGEMLENLGCQWLEHKNKNVRTSENIKVYNNNNHNYFQKFEFKGIPFKLFTDINISNKNNNKPGFIIGRIELPQLFENFPKILFKE